MTGQMAQSGLLEPMQSEVVSNLPLLSRDLSKIEVNLCEQSCVKYIQNDAFEIEINNLNEVNEYFRIFKDIVLEKDKEI